MTEHLDPRNKTSALHSLAQPLREVLSEIGFTSLTPIQEQSLPILLQGSDLIGQSQTGSGKTAAYALPLLQQLRLEPRRIQALVLCPTRELCAQVAREIRRLGRRLPGLQVLALAGGQPLGPQMAALEKGVHILVGTPGRVLDHVRRNNLQLNHLRTLILDEADRMLDMGFEEDMEKILAAAPVKRQTVLFSATFSPTIASMSARYQRQPQRVTIEASKPEQAMIRQLVCEVHANDKQRAVISLLAAFRPESGIIFCNQKATADEVKKALVSAGASAACLHGDLEQFERDLVMAKLRNGSIRLLVATDVAARGLDVADLDLVVNYDLPGKPEVYVHRIGRTGRAGKTGLAVSLATPRDQYRVQSIRETTGQQLERYPLSLTAPAVVEHKQAEMATLQIGGGRKDKLRPGDILGAFTGEAGGMQSQDIGKIEIHDHFSYVAISKYLVPQALERLREGRIKARRFSVELVR